MNQTNHADQQLDDLLLQGKLRMFILNNQTWTETMSRHRTVRGLRKWYWQMAKQGDVVGYQFVTVHEHNLGRPSKPYCNP